MRKLKQKIKLESKNALIGQYGGNDSLDFEGEFEVIEKHQGKYAKSIGHLIISFSFLEDVVDKDLATSINERAYEPGYRIIKYLEFRNKIDLLRDQYAHYIKVCCVRHKKEKLLSELHVIYLKLIELSEFRNKIAHANWASLDKAGFVRYQAKEDRGSEAGGMIFEKFKMTPSVVLKFIRQNQAVSSKIDLFREKVWEAARLEQYRLYKQGEKEKKRN